MRLALVPAIILFALTGCVSEQVTYERDLQPNYISRHARFLSQGDREEIARLMSHRTNQPILCLCAGQGRNSGTLFIYTAYIGAHERTDYGFFALRRIDGHWQIIEGGTDLDPILVGMLCSDDR